MDSNSKTPKVSRNSSDDQEDRLSSLPVSIIRHILSFLPTKHAAATSILSKEWRYIFLGVTKINIDEYLVLHPQEQGCIGHDNEDFIEFVNRQLMLSKTSSITEFRLKCWMLPEPIVFDSWMTTLLSRNVQVLEIEELSYINVVVPNQIFSCRTLVVLKLCGHSIVLNVPDLVCLQNLKELHLSCLDMECESGNLRFGEGYPCLEELRMDEVGFPNNETLAISISTLRKFTFCGEFLNPNGLRRIDIDTSHLEYFEYNRFSLIRPPSMELNICNCESLLQVDLLLEANLALLMRMEFTWLSNFFRNIYNVKAFNVSWIFLQGFYECTRSLPQFPNLIHLELTAKYAHKRKPMWILLEGTPNLETLVFDMGKGRETDYGAPKVVPLCLAQKLKEIRITYFEGYQFDIELMRYLLQYGAVLERMIIDRPYNEKSKEWPSSILKQY